MVPGAKKAAFPNYCGEWCSCPTHPFNPPCKNCYSKHLLTFPSPPNHNFSAIEIFIGLFALQVPAYGAALLLCFFFLGVAFHKLVPACRQCPSMDWS